MNKKSLMAVTLATTAFSLSACASTPSQSAATTGRIIEYKSGPEGFDTRTFFYEGEREVIAFDAQFTPDLARKSLEHLRTFTDKPITWLVITHPNPDKFNGAAVFKAEGARIVASKATADAISGVHAYKKYYFVNLAKMFTDDTYPSPVAVDEVFTNDLTLNLAGGETIELSELNRPAISTNQTVAWIPSVKALLVGDLVHHHAHAWLEGGIVNGQPTPAIASWIETLNLLKAEYPQNATVLGGRGESANIGEAIDEQIKYLQKAEQMVRNYVDELGHRAPELNSEKAGQHYKAIAQEFEREFPEYALPYMIEYGVYGLVNDELAQQK